MSQQPPDELRPNDDFGEYELAPEGPPPPKWRTPIRVARLEYQPKDETGVAKVSSGGQFLLGMISPYLYTLAAMGILMPLHLRDATVGALIPLLILGYIAMVAAIRIWTEWTAFIPGVLCSVFLLPVAGPLIICGVAGVNADFR